MMKSCLAMQCLADSVIHEISFYIFIAAIVHISFCFLLLVPCTQ